jgi:hypothetical protein
MGCRPPRSRSPGRPITASSCMRASGATPRSSSSGTRASSTTEIQTSGPAEHPLGCIGRKAGSSRSRRRASARAIARG